MSKKKREDVIADLSAGEGLDVDGGASSPSTKIGNYFIEDKPLDFISTGSVLLDCAIGGGYPIGRMVNIVGDKSTGKSLMAIEACINFHKKYPDGRIYYFEAEAAFDKGYAQALGMPIEAITFVGEENTEEVVEGLVSENTVEFLFEHLEYLIGAEEKKKKASSPVLYIIDSMDALSDRAELDRDIDKGSYGAAKPKLLSELFRRLVSRLKQTNILLLVISQVRDNIGVSFGEKHKRSGGKALDFYASQIIWFSEIKKHTKVIRGVTRPIGVEIKAKCKKNKIGLPYRECHYNIMFGYGVDDVTSNLDWLHSVKALEDLGFKSSEIKEIAEAVKAGDIELGQKIIEHVKKTWKEIEMEFMPVYKKY